MSNVLSEEKKKQVIIAPGQLGLSLRQIQKHTGVRRETAGEYLKAAGVSFRPPGSWGEKSPSKPAKGVTTEGLTGLTKASADQDMRVSFAYAITPRNYEARLALKG